MAKSPMPTPPLPVRRTQGTSARALDTRKAEAEAKRAAAESQARAAEAQARAAEAQARVEAQRIKAERERAAAAAKQAPYERAYQLGINVAAPAAGIALGHLTAKSIEKRHLAFRGQADKQINALAKQAAKIVDKPLPRGAAGQAKAARLAGIVKTADQLNVLKARGPVGLTRAALLVAEGAYVRFGLAPKVENPVAREALNAVGSLSLFAATTQIGERVVQNATLRKVPAAASVATIETARNVAARAGAMTQAAPAPARRAAARAGSIASRTAVPSVAAAGRLGAAVRVGLGVAAKVALPLQVGFTAVAAVRGFRQGGLRGAAVAAGDSLTFGAVSAIGRTVAAYGGQKRVASARAAVARAAAVRTATEMRRTSTLRAAAARATAGGDGRVSAYTRMQRGRMVRVSGYRRG